MPRVVLSDAFDEKAWERACADSDALAAILASGAALHPGFEELGADVFHSLFKYTLTHVPASDSTRARTALARQVVGWLHTAPAFAVLRAETVLDEARSTFAARLVLGAVLRTLRRSELFDADDLLAAFRADQGEAELEDLDEQLEVARELGEDTAANSIQAEMDAARSKIKRDEARWQALIDALPTSLPSGLRDLTGSLPDRMDEAEGQLEAVGQGFGATGSGHGGADKLDLGDQLLHNEKLKRLADLVGAFRPAARAFRREKIERRPAEIHAVERGNALSRLLPSEAAALGHRILRRDFLRRYVEGDLLQYAIEANAPAQKGPLVVAVDGSGSMRGERELWAKAVALTLLEIARRGRRYFRAVVFSHNPKDLRTFDLLAAPRTGLRAPPPPVADLMKFAEYFPSGGTDFQAPLDAAVALIEEHPKLKRADIVLITDGQAAVSDPWRVAFDRARIRLGFQLYGVVVDPDAGRRGPPQPTPAILTTLCDRVSRVSDLTADGARDIFVSV